MVLDFGTEALKVLSEGRRFLKYFDDYDYPGVLSRTIELVFGGIEKKSGQILVVLPPSILKARIVSQVFKRRASQKVISGKEEKEINETVLQRAKKEVSISFSQLSGIFPEHLRFVSLRILERGIKIDGYEVPRLEGYDGKILEFKILAVFLPGFTEIERILRRSLMPPHHLTPWLKPRQKTGDFKIVHAAEGLIRILEDYPDGVFLDVGGEITQIFLAREGKLEAVCELGFGGKIFSEAISERLGLREKDARLLKERYSKEGLTPESSSKIKEIFHFPSRLWFDNLKEKLKETQGGLLFPSNVFLFGGGSQLPEIKEILEMGKWGSIAFFDAKPKVKILDDPQFLIALSLKSYGQKSY